MGPFNLRTAARLRLERDIAAFERRGGKIQRLPTTRVFQMRDDIDPEYAAKRARGRAAQGQMDRQGRAQR